MKFLHMPDLRRDVSRLGIGSLKFNTESQGETANLLDACQRAGGNLIDTAEIYGRGKSERAIGNYLKIRGTRAQWVVLTKACVEPSLVRPDYIREAVPRSLDRLQTNYIDLFVLHRDDPCVPVAELVDVMNELVNEHLILAYGFSNWTVARLAEAKRYAECNSRLGPCLSSPHLGLATPIEPMWPGCTHATAEDQDGMRKVGYRCLAGQRNAEAFLPVSRTHKTQQTPISCGLITRRRISRKLARVRELAKTRGVQPVQVALAWVLNQRAATVALVGPNSVNELEIALGGVEIALSSAEMSRLEDS